MREITRRGLGVALAALAAGVRAEAQTDGRSLRMCKVFTPGLTKMPNGSERWSVMEGILETGEAVSMHESVVPGGTRKSAAHLIEHSEFVIVVEGTLSFEHDGRVEEVNAGSVAYVAYGSNHLVWNSGASTARYFVFQVGGDTKKSGG